LVTTFLQNFELSIEVTVVISVAAGKKQFSKVSCVEKKKKKKKSAMNSFFIVKSRKEAPIFVKGREK